MFLLLVSMLALFRIVLSELLPTCVSSITMHVLIKVRILHDL